MAWTAPMTAVANAVFTAAQFNTHVRDNLLETAPGKASAAGNLFVSTAANSIRETTPTYVAQANSGTTTSTSYTATLSGSPGTNPSITINTGPSAIVAVGANSSGSSAIPAQTFVSIAVSGGTTIAASDSLAFRSGGTAPISGSNMSIISGLNTGSNTFTLQYKVTSGTGTFDTRSLLVLPL